VVVVVILIAVLINSCQASQRTNALKDYTNNVNSLIAQSNETGARLFAILSSGGGSANGPTLQNRVNETRASAETVLSHAQQMSVPDEVKTANQHLLLALQMRLDGITNIASEIQPALGSSTSKDAINSLAAETARFYGSDVLYKNYTAPQIAGALHAAGISVGGASGETLNAGQFVPDVQWLLPSFIASKLNVSVPGTTTGGKVAPGLHGHSLDSVSVDGTTLQTGSTNTIPVKPAPTFTLNLTNGGTNNETNVGCKVSVTGTSSSGQTVIPETTAGQHTSCQVKLTTAPAAGTYTVVATVAKVPGEKNITNNSLSFPVTFQ
jgi:hypothetical protein